MDKKVKKIIILLFLVILFGVLLVLRWKKNTSTGIVGSYVYETKCEADTTKGENGVSTDTLTLKKDGTFLLEQDGCWNVNMLEGNYTYDSQKGEIVLENEMASFIETVLVRNPDTLIRLDEVDREMVYTRKK